MTAPTVPFLDFEQKAADRSFQTQPPANNPLAASSSVSVVTKDEKTDQTVFDWTPTEAIGVTDSAVKVLDLVIERCRRDVKKYPHSSRAHANLGIALLNQSRTEEAIQEFNSALEINPNHYVAAVNLAKIRVGQGRYDEAENIYHSLAAAYPEDATIYLSLGVIATRKRDLIRAEQLLRKAIDLGENSSVAKYQLAMLQLNLNRYREAVSLLKSSVREDVRSPELYQGLGIAYFLSNDMHRAEMSFKAALTLAPGMGAAVKGLARVLLKVGRIDDALRLLTDYLEEKKDDIDAREILGGAYFRIKQYHSARAQFNYVLRSLPEESSDQKILHRRAGLLNSIGACVAREGQKKQALSWFLKSIEIDPQYDPLAYRNLATTYRQMRREIDALKVASECKTRFPRDQECRVLLASILEDAEMYHEAIRELEPLLEWDTPAASVFSSLSTLLEATGNSEASVRILRNGLARYPKDPSITHNLIYMLLMTDEVIAARNLLESSQKVLSSYMREEPDYEAVYTATLGLLSLKEGDIETGAGLYRAAVRVATKLHNRQLTMTALQKLHLEIARAYLNKGEKKLARLEIEKGLAIQRGKASYRDALKKLKESPQSS